MSILGAGPEDHLSAIATGDVNGDGRPDLVVGASGVAGEDGSEAGAVYLLAGPLTGTRSWDLKDRPPTSTIRGIASGDRLGRAVTVGDLNGDGLAEIIVAAPEADGLKSERVDSGEVYVIPGSQSPAKAYDLAGEPPFLTLAGARPGDNAGWTLLATDLNGDALDDLIIGAPLASRDAARGEEAGIVYVLFGSRDLPRSTLDLATGFPGATIFGTESGGRLGWSLAAGDTDGDGTPELIVGAPFAYPGGDRRAAGKVYALPPPRPGDVKSVDDLTAVRTISGRALGDQVGYSLAAADINGDGTADILAGAVSADGPTGERELSGAAFVFYGGGSPELDMADSAADVSVWGSHPDDRLGRSVALGDVDADGGQDLMLAAPSASRPDEDAAKAGLVLVIRGSARLPAQFDLAARDPDAIIVGPRADSILGHGNFGRPSLVSADLDGDGRSDVAVAAPAEGPADRAGAGTVYAILSVDLHLQAPVGTD